jgi:Trypsin-like peptidase domain
VTQEHNSEAFGQGIGPRTTAEVIQEHLVDFAISHCAAIRFGRSLNNGTFEVLSCASATLLTLDRHPFIITSDHVVRAYETNERANHFQVGRAAFDPQPRVVDRNAAIDLCVLDAIGLDINDRLPIDPVPPAGFYSPRKWPPDHLQGGEKLLWAGFPTSLRHIERGEQFAVPLCFSNATLSRVDGRFLVVNLDPDRAAFKLHHGEHLTIGSPELRVLGGMSGGPVFVDVIGAISPYLVGVISEYQEDVNQTRISRLDAVRNNGTIIKGSLS